MTRREFQHLGEVSNMTECIELACNASKGELAYRLDDECFVVNCAGTCDLFNATHVDSAAARLNRTGRTSIKAKTLNVTSFLISNILDNGAALLEHRVKYTGVIFKRRQMSTKS